MTLRVALALAAAAAAAAAPARAAPGAAAGSCPGAARPFAAPPSRAELAPAAAAALRFARSRWAPPRGLLTLGMAVAGIRWAPTDPALRYIRSVCGDVALAATVAVSVVFPVMYDEPGRPPPGCEYCAVVELLVARGARGWSVWDAL